MLVNKNFTGLYIYWLNTQKRLHRIFIWLLISIGYSLVRLFVRLLVCFFLLDLAMHKQRKKIEM